jgi:hypothetical protein
MKLVIEVNEIPKEVMEEFAHIVTQFVNEYFEFIKAVKIEYEEELPRKPLVIPYQPFPFDEWIKKHQPIYQWQRRKWDVKKYYCDIPKETHKYLTTKLRLRS